MEVTEIIKKRNELIEQIAFSLHSLIQKTIFDSEIDKLVGFSELVPTRFSKDFKYYNYLFFKDEYDKYRTDEENKRHYPITDLATLKSILLEQKDEVIRDFIQAVIVDLAKIKEGIKKYDGITVLQNVLIHIKTMDEEINK